MSIALTNTKQINGARFTLSRNGHVDLDKKVKQGSSAHISELRTEAKKAKLSLKPIELEYLEYLASEFEKEDKLFKGTWKAKVVDYLRTINTDLDTIEALEKAIRISNKKILARVKYKLKAFAKSVEANFIKKHSTKDPIQFFKQLGRKAEQTSSNPNFKNQHILLLGEHHVGLEQEDGSFYNPPTAWLEANLDKLRAAGYDTLALEVPYDVEEDSWLEFGNSAWGYPLEEHLKVILKLAKEAIEYFENKALNPKDLGVLLFKEKLHNWILKKREERKLGSEEISVSYKDPKKPEENTRKRWLEFARKAEKAGFRILTTDASKKITRESGKIVYFFKALLDDIPNKTDGIKLIQEYLTYKRGLLLTARDTSMANSLEEALKVSENSVVGLYGANHVKTALANSRTSAQRILKRRNIPNLSIRMEFPGMLDDNKYSLLDKRINPEPSEEPQIIKLSDMPFAQSQKITSYRNFQVKDKRFKVDNKDNPKIGEQAPHDAVMLFPIRKDFKPAQNS